MYHLIDICTANTAVVMMLAPYQAQTGQWAYIFGCNNGSYFLQTDQRILAVSIVADLPGPSPVFVGVVQASYYPSNYDLLFPLGKVIAFGVSSHNNFFRGK